MSEYDLHPISTKAALFDADCRRVLVMEYLPAKQYIGYGLPGGHLDAGEDPDVAIRRELEEELGLMNVEVVKAGFYMHPEGKIILGYTGILAAGIMPIPSRPDIETGVWHDSDTFAKINIAQCYRKLVLSSWPE